VHLLDYNSVTDNPGLSSFVEQLLHLKHAKCHEIPRKLDLTVVQGHPRSLILVSIESPYVKSYSLLIVTSAVSATVFEIFTLKDRKLLILPTPPLFDASTWGRPLRIPGWNLTRIN